MGKNYLTLWIILFFFSSSSLPSLPSLLLHLLLLLLLCTNGSTHGGKGGGRGGGWERKEVKGGAAQWGRKRGGAARVGGVGSATPWAFGPRWQAHPPARPEKRFYLLKTKSILFYIFHFMLIPKIIFLPFPRFTE